MRNNLNKLLRKFKNMSNSSRSMGMSTMKEPHRAYGMAKSDLNFTPDEGIQESQLEQVLLPNADVFSYVFQQARKWQKKTFAECALTGQKYTYGETVEGALRFAGVLRKVSRGNPNTTVAFISPNSPGLLVMYCGCFAAGMPITPINPLYTPAEIASQLEDSGASILIVDALMEPLADAAFQVMGKTMPVIVNGSSTCGRPNAQELLSDESIPLESSANIDPNSTAFLPYSSGTTGKPKGVCISHAALTNNMSMYLTDHFHPLQYANKNHQDTQLGILPFFHIYGLMGTLLPSLFYGSKLITMPKFDPTLFISTLKRHKMSSLQLVPPLVDFIGQCPMINKQDLESVRSIIVGAAPLPESSALKLKEKTSSIAIQEGYGMTELLLTHITPIYEDKSGYCGKLLPNSQAKIVDPETGNSLPADCPGELWIKSPSMMTGYHNNEAATKDTIVDGWMKTGDIAQYTEDGLYRIVDRIKELIKVKGLQVSPTEIEKELQEVQGIEEVGVIGVPDSKLGEAPAAFIVQSDESLTKEKVEAFMKERFSKHKQLVGGIHFVEDLPKNHLGKLLRRQLKEMAVA